MDCMLITATDKISRSGRLVKTPGKLQDMQIVTSSGSRSILLAPPAPPQPSKTNQDRHFFHSKRQNPAAELSETWEEMFPRKRKRSDKSDSTLHHDPSGSGQKAEASKSVAHGFPAARPEKKKKKKKKRGRPVGSLNRPKWRIIMDDDQQLEEEASGGSRDPVLSDVAIVPRKIKKQRRHRFRKANEEAVHYLQAVVGSPENLLGRQSGSPELPLPSTHPASVAEENQVGAETEPTEEIAGADSQEKRKKKKRKYKWRRLENEEKKLPRRKHLSRYEKQALRDEKKALLQTDLNDVIIPFRLTEEMRGKRQVTAYLAFCRKERPTVLKLIPNGTFTELSVELGRRWSNLPEDEKVAWKLVALKLTALYKAEAETGIGVPPKPAKNRLDDVTRQYANSVRGVVSGSVFEFVVNFRMLSDQLFWIADVNTFTNPKAKYRAANIPAETFVEPAGCLDLLLDSAFVLITSALGIVAQVPIIGGGVDKEVLDDLAVLAADVMPNFCQRTAS